MDDEVRATRDLVYTPAEASSYAVRHIERLREGKQRQVALNIPGIRDYFGPLLPGQSCAVVAQTSNYKSGFMHCWADLLARQLQAEGRGDECIIHVSVEEDVEEQVFLELARMSHEDAGRLARGEYSDYSGLMRAAIKVGQVPIYRLGTSVERAEARVNLSLSGIVRGIKYLRDELHDHPLKIAAIFFDYIQAFPLDPERQRGGGEWNRRLQVREDVYDLRRIAGTFKCPVIVGSQAKQKLDYAMGPNMLLPGIYDASETSAIGERCDRVITLWMPKMTHPRGTVHHHGDEGFLVEDNLLYVCVRKQRGGLPSGGRWKCYIDFQKNTITPQIDDEGQKWHTRN